VTALAGAWDVEPRPRAVRVEDLGELVPISRVGGQGRVYRPQFAPASLGSGPFVVKLYRRAPPPGAAHVLADMVAWGRSLSGEQHAWLHALTAWPLAVVHRGQGAAGIVMRDVSSRFSVPFVMPSGRRDRVLLTLEHLLGGDGYLELRGLGIRLDTRLRAAVAERMSGGLGFLHRNAVAASDIAPNNLLVAVGGAGGPAICFIDCDSMAFHGRSPLTCVQTADWDLPAEFDEPSDTRAADAYKLGLVILRLFARSHDARAPAPHLRYVPVELRDLLYRALGHSVVNRPAAGEWQRALRGLLADGRLNERYPGPAPVPRPLPAPAPAPAASAVTAPRVRAVGSAPALAGASALARAPALRPAPVMRPAAARAVAVANSTTAAVWLRRAVIVLWIVAGTAVLLVLLSRLFAAAVPVPVSGSGPPAYQYYYPGGGRFQGGGPGGGQLVP
jgi:eukaryotic-like serine/threonine-protein kinase